MVVQKKRAGWLFFASIADFGDDLLAQHLAAVIEDFNQARAGGAGVGQLCSGTAGDQSGSDGGAAVRVSAEATPPKKLDVLPVLRRLSGPEIQTI
jgi:hypothetical protein